MCRNLRHSGASRQLKTLRIFLLEDFCYDAPEVVALILECAAVARSELCMQSFRYRDESYVECDFLWIAHIFEAAPSTLTTLQIPLSRLVERAWVSEIYKT